MNFRIEAVPPQEWNKLAPQVHALCFGEERPSSMNTYDYALVACNDDMMYSYATIIEMNAESAYMQHGGALPSAKNSVHTKRTYHAMLEWLKERYKYISTRIENKNIPMLKLAMSEGLLVYGCDCFPDRVYLNCGWVK